MDFKNIASRYEIGSIVELKVEKKLDENQLVIFNLDGTSARLHISNISNSPDLSKNLFDIIRIGESIMSVIIGFNQEKEYVELSLKPLRNQLEGSLSFTRCKRVVDARKEMRINLPKDILEENRNQLDRIQGDLAKVDLTFLYELIQNAIDHPNPNFKNLLSIKFEVYNDYLLLKHNGSIFTENNFRSLTGILLGEEDTGEERIGYKGIGFKSIFRYTQEVYIRSGNFSFSFSKERSGGKNPWEVIPIFENEINKVEEIKNFEFFNTPVAFAFKFTNPELKNQAITYLEQLVATPETLLFLNRLSRLEIIVDGSSKKITRQVIDCETHNKIHLQLNEQTPQEWLVCKEKSVITDELILKELTDENNPSIPLKFRGFKTPEIQVAFPIEKREGLINMYAYLPLSETNCGLPYIVNSDFIPNLDRTDLIKNLKYNNALAKLTAGVLSNLFKVITREYGIEQALTLIPQFDVSTTEFFKGVNEAFIEKQDDLVIVLPSNEEVQLKDFVIDTSSIFKIFDKKEIQMHNQFKNSYVFDKLNPITADQLKNSLGVTVFTIQHGIELLTKPEIADKYYSDFSSLAMLLFRISRLPNASDWFNKMSRLKLVNKKESFFALNDLYSHAPILFEEMFGKVLQIEILNAEQNELLTKYPRIANVFESFGLKKYNLNEVLRQLISSSNNLKKEENKVFLNHIWHFLYLNREAVNEDGSRIVNERFKQFPINTIDGGIEMLESCFAGDVQNTENNFSFLHDHYGKDHLLKINISELAELITVNQKEIVSFLSTIHGKVKLTDKVLFRRALKRVCSLSAEELISDKTSVLKALISVFSYNYTYPEDNLFEHGMFMFPVLTITNEIQPITSTYFDNSFDVFFETNELYAEMLFKDVIDIPFISKDYLNYVDEDKKEKFIQFLKSNYVSSSIKFFKSSLLRKRDRVNLTEADEVYKSYNNGYFNFRTSDEFFVFKDVAKLSGLYENLKVFWVELSKIKPLNLVVSEISCNGYARPNPLIWLLNTNQVMFPMQSGEVKPISEVHSKELQSFLIDSGDKLEKCFNSTLDPVIAKIKFKTALSNSVIINCLKNLKQLSEEKRKILLLDYFSTANFSKDERELIINNGFLLAKDQSVQLAKELIYIDSDLNSTSLVMEQTTYPNTSIMETFDHNPSFRNKILQLSSLVKGVNQIELREYDENVILNTEYFNKIISDFGSSNLSSETEKTLLNESMYVACNIINIGLINVPKFQANTDSFHQSTNNTYYFTGIRDLIDLLCDKFNWPIAFNRKLRKLLEGDNQRKIENKEEKRLNKYTEEEISQIKSLFGRELPDDELEEENLYAQIKALRYFKDKGYDTSGAEANFNEHFDDKFLSPIVDDNANAHKVMCRSARRGILYLGAYAWDSLSEINTLLYILTGDNSLDCILINNQEELENRFNDEYKVLRRKNATAEELRNLISAETNLGDLQLLYKVKGNSFDVIFNPQRNIDKKSEGPLTDIGVEI